MNPLSLIAGAKPALIAGGAALIIGTAGGFYIGNKLGDAKVDRIINKTLIRNVRVMQKADVISQEVGTKTAQAEERERVVTRTIQQQVVKYVPLKGSCDVVPSGVVSLHDAAATGSPLPSSPAEPADTPSGVGYDQAWSVVVANYGQCRTDQARLLGLQEWVARNVALFNKEK